MRYLGFIFLLFTSVCFAPTPNLFGCWELMIYAVGGTDLRTIRTSEIDAENLPHFFTHEYEPGHWGAKGIAYRDLHNHTHVVFWRTEGVPFQHSHALAMFIEADAQILDSLGRGADEAAAVYLQGARDASKAKNFTEAGRLMQLAGVEGHKGTDFRRQAREYRACALAVPMARFTPTLTDDILWRMEAFEFTVKPEGPNKIPKIVEFNISSMLVGVQVKQLQDRGAKVSGAVLARLIVRTHNAIDLAVRGYDNKIQTNGLIDQTFTDGDEFRDILKAAGLTPT